MCGKGLDGLVAVSGGAVTGFGFELGPPTYRRAELTFLAAGFDEGLFCLHVLVSVEGRFVARGPRRPFVRRVFSRAL